MSRRERLQAWMRPVVRWLYVATAMLILPLVLEGLLEQVGIVRSPEEALPDAVHGALLFAALAVGGVIFLGWPFALAVIGLYRREWLLSTPAILFLVAEVSFAVYTLGFPGSNTMFVVSGALLGVYAIAAVWAWARGGARSRARGSAAVILSLLLLGSCSLAWDRQTWLSEIYANPLVLPGTDLILLEGRIPPLNAEIFTARRDGSELRNLTHDSGEDIVPVPSPDGRWILFVSDRDGAEALYRMASDGSGATKLADSVSGLSDIGWIPGGADVVFAAREGITISASDGSGEPRLFVADAWDPLWSPDGRWMLYQGGPQRTEMHVIAADGSRDLNLADGWAMTWLPDASALLFHATGSRPALSDVYMIRVDGSGRERIMTDVLLSGRAADPGQGWSPDGTRLALPAADVGGLWSRDGIVILDREGRLVRDLRRRQEYLHNGTVAWLDNRTVVLSKLYNPGGLEFGLSRDPGGVYLIDVESGEERQIIRNAEIVVDPDKPPW